MVKACIFDWGGVVIDNPSYGFIQYFSQKLHTDPTGFKRLLSSLGKEYSLGLSENDFWKKIYSQLSISASIPFPVWTDSLPGLFLEKKRVTNAIFQLRKKGKKIGLLSNTEMPFAEYFFTQSYAPLFDAAVFSCVVKILKPDPKIYKIICSKLGVDPKETVFVDDKKENIKTAEDLGMRGILFTKENEVVEELIGLA